MAPKNIVVIGAGISGLSAGCYALLDGCEVQIHEAHSGPGGLCTGWKRGDYWIDGCIHWLTSSRPGDELYKVWEDLGVVQGRQFYDHEIFSSLVGIDGRKLYFYTDAGRLEEHLNQLSPADSEAIRYMCGAIRRLSRFETPAGKAPELMGTWDSLKMMAKMMPFMKDFMDIGSLTLGQLGARFKDPLIREAISKVLWEEQMPALALITTLANMNRKAAGFPLGGSLDLARAVEKRFLSLGGRVHYRSRVAKILERGGQVCGVRLADGTEISADVVISATDLHRTLNTLLDGRRADPLHLELLETGRTFKPMVMATFGVNLDFSTEITCLGTNYQLEAPVELCGQRLSQVGVKNYCYDPSMSPAGKSVVGIGFSSDWNYWERVPYNSPAYHAEKEHLCEVSQRYLERYYPGARARIEMVDIVTPYTYERYTGNRHGVYMTWMVDGAFQRKHPFIPKKVPGLSGLYIASMWTKPPGGIPGAALVGREVAQIIRHQDR